MSRLLTHDEQVYRALAGARLLEVHTLDYHNVGQIAADAVINILCEAEQRGADALEILESVHSQLIPREEEV